MRPARTSPPYRAPPGRARLPAAAPASRNPAEGGARDRGRPRPHVSTAPNAAKWGAPLALPRQRRACRKRAGETPAHPGSPRLRRDALPGCAGVSPARLRRTERSRARRIPADPRNGFADRIPRAPKTLDSQIVYAEDRVASGAGCLGAGAPEARTARDRGRLARTSATRARPVGGGATARRRGPEAVAPESGPRAGASRRCEPPRRRHRVGAPSAAASGAIAPKARTAWDRGRPRPHVSTAPSAAEPGGSPQCPAGCLAMQTGLITIWKFVEKRDAPRAGRQCRPAQQGPGPRRRPATARGSEPPPARAEKKFRARKKNACPSPVPPPPPPRYRGAMSSRVLLSGPPIRGSGPTAPAGCRLGAEPVAVRSKRRVDIGRRRRSGATDSQRPRGG